MKRFCLLLLLLFLLPCPRVSAAEIEIDVTPNRSVTDGTEVKAALEAALPASAELYEKLESGDTSTLWGMLSAVFSDLFEEPLKLAVALTANVMLAALLQTVLAMGKSAAQIGSFCSAAVFAAALLPVLQTLVNACHARIGEFNNLLAALLPFFSLVATASGGVGLVTAERCSVYLVSAVIERVLASLLPVCRILAALAVATAVSGFDFSGAIGWLRDAYAKALGFFTMLVSTICGFSGATAAARDSVALRSVRFVAGSFIPVVGNAVGDALRTVAGTLKWIGWTGGTVIFVSILLLSLPLFLRLMLTRLAVSFGAALARVAGLGAETRLLDGSASVLSLLLATLAAATGIFLLATVIFLRCATEVPV